MPFNYGWAQGSLIHLNTVKNLRLRYLFGLSAIALLATASYITMYTVVSKQRDFAKLINLASHQSGLTNRIAYFSSLMASTSDQSEFDLARSQVGRTIHKLINKAETPEALFEMATTGSKKVCLIEMTNRIGKEIGKSTRWGMMQDLERFNVETVTGAKVVRITETGLEIEKVGKISALDFDTVVVAAGAVSYNPLAQIAQKLAIDYRMAGDALKVGTAFDAVHGGYEAAVSISG